MANAVAVNALVQEPMANKVSAVTGCVAAEFAHANALEVNQPHRP